MPSKIEWTDALLPMPLNVATFAQRNDIKPMGFGIAKMVVVFFRWFSTITAREFDRANHSSAFDLIAHCARCLRLQLGRWSFALASFANLNPPTINTTSSKPVTTTRIGIKLTALFPGLALPTPFKTVVNFLKIFVKSNADSLSSNFHCTYFRTHVTSYIELV